MKRSKLSILFLSLVITINLYGYNWDKSHNKWGYFSMYEWKEQGVSTYEEAKSWYKIGIEPGYQLKQLKKLKLNAESAKLWKDTCPQLKDYCIKKWINLGISPNDVSQWNKAGVISSNSILSWKKLNVTTPELAKEWLTITSDLYYAKFWIEAGIKNPKEVTKWKAIGVDRYTIKDIKKANLSIDTVSQWIKHKVKIKNIAKLINAGFEDYSDYEDYKVIAIDNAVKLKKWNIEPNKLIESMSYGNIIFGEELFFKNKKVFMSAYNSLNENCEEIIKDKWFSSIDMNHNEDKCYIFAGEMIQRLDEKSFFGTITQAGLVNGLAKRNFYAKKFQTSWLEKETKIGVIKGNGSFSYNSNSGKQVIPTGTVIFLK